jgi:hypothetical protein
VTLESVFLIQEILAALVRNVSSSLSWKYARRIFPTEIIMRCGSGFFQVNENYHSKLKPSRCFWHVQCLIWGRERYVRSFSSNLLESWKLYWKFMTLQKPRDFIIASSSSSCSKFSCLLITRFFNRNFRSTSRLNETL